MSSLIQEGCFKFTIFTFAEALRNGKNTCKRPQWFSVAVFRNLLLEKGMTVTRCHEVIHNKGSQVESFGYN